jgi:hypothetical protein
MIQSKRNWMQIGEEVIKSLLMNVVVGPKKL